MIPVKLEAADGTTVEPVAEFVYLGSNITRDGHATKEVRRRIGMGGVEPEVGIVPVAGGVYAAAQCRVAHA